MPFQSKSQAAWMFSHKPAMAKEWASKTADMKKLPKKLHPSKTVKLRNTLMGKKPY